MRNRGWPKSISAALIVVVGLAGGLPAGAGVAVAGSMVRLAQAEEVTLQQAAQQVQRTTGGRILAAETVRREGRILHRIKVLTDSGVVRVVVVDAQSGAMR